MNAPFTGVTPQIVTQSYPQHKWEVLTTTTNSAATFTEQVGPVGAYASPSAGKHVRPAGGSGRMDLMFFGSTNDSVLNFDLYGFKPIHYPTQASLEHWVPFLIAAVTVTIGNLTLPTGHGLGGTKRWADTIVVDTDLTHSATAAQVITEGADQRALLSLVVGPWPHLGFGLYFNTTLQSGGCLWSPA